ncbi:hypothetical protein ACFVWR_13235 [Leifsonia sp. NPDC058292]|uniref:hypothetical protein n=1 Tax=Leifsonia sp. NPDC058292 TaxID=3346428 RepID=UPI0036DBFF70
MLLSVLDNSVVGRAMPTIASWAVSTHERRFLRALQLLHVPADAGDERVRGAGGRSGSVESRDALELAARLVQ